MSLEIYVNACSGYRANERPISFELNEEIHEIAEIQDRWYEPDAEIFTVRTNDGKTYLLRHNQQDDTWTLRSGFDGDELLTRPGIEVVTVDVDQVREAERRIEGCEHCHPDESDLPLDWLLEEVTGRTGMVEFLMSVTAKCPNCTHPLNEKTFVQFS